MGYVEWFLIAVVVNAVHISVTGQPWMITIS
jgi:hypothetical protein